MNGKNRQPPDLSEYEAALENINSDEDFSVPDTEGLQTENPLVPSPNFYEQAKHKTGLGPSTLSIIEEAERRGIPWQRLNERSKIRLGFGTKQKIIRATITGDTGCIATETADDKFETKILLQKTQIPVPRGIVCKSLAELQKAVEEIGFPIVIKPLDANQGKGVTVAIESIEMAEEAFIHAQKFSSDVLVENYIAGHDHRLLVIDGKLVAASRRQPAHVVGNGTNTISELIEEINKEPGRGDGHEALLTKITLDCDTENLLKKNNLSLETVLLPGETLVLKSTANLSTGGTATDVTAEVHPANVFMAERIAAIIGLDICGIDLVAKDLHTPLTENGGAVIEVNAAPGLRMHLSPSNENPGKVAAAIVDMLFPGESNGRIPVFAVTGTNGKTTTTRLLRYIAKSCGHMVGYTTTDGIYIGDFQIAAGDCSGPTSASLVLSDPMVDFAVLETARGGLLRSGLAFDFCDVGILTNIAADHLGLKNINTLEELAEVRATVVRNVKPEGWAVINAEDIHCLNISKTLSCNIAYFSLDADHSEILKHLANGGLAAFVSDDRIIIQKDDEENVLGTLSEFPLTLNGTSRCMTANILAAAAGAFAYGFTAKQISSALRNFSPCPELTPGRMNFFKVRDFEVLVDYAHNPHGLTALQDYFCHSSQRRKIGIVAAVGDRRNEDIIELARIAANMFDHIIVRQEHSLRGRELAEMNSLMIEGMKKGKRCAGYELIPDEEDAIRHALSIARTSDLVVALSDNYQNVTKIVQEF